mmetsp:Transcript_33729/g.82917  ORF Transcript_33729/g.82917 Transcript_33729/m.82917 type:complete len:772 (-) Transcript_33729:2926-5241(-)
MARTISPGQGWARGLLLLLAAAAHAYPDISGSCLGPQGEHVPNEVAPRDPGSFSVEIRDQAETASGQQAVIVVADARVGSLLTGFLVKALDAATGAPMGVFDEGALPPGSSIFEGCTGLTSVTHDREADYSLPLSFGITWPKGKELAVQAFLVVEEKEWYEVWGSTLQSAAYPQPDCPRARLSAAAVVIGLCPLFVIAMAGILLKSRGMDRWRNLLEQTVPFGKDVAPRNSKLIGLLTFDILSTIREATLGELLAFLLFALSQIIVLILSIRLITSGAPKGSDEEGKGIAPWDGAFARALGHLLMIDFTNVLMMPTRNSVWVGLVGISFERMVKYHRCLGRMTVFTMVVHGAVMVKHWGISDVFSADHTCFGYGKLWGSLAGICVLLGLGVGAHEVVRRTNYDAFLLAHTVAFPALISAGMHATDFFYFLIVPIALYALDYGMRIMHWRRPVLISKAQPLPGGIVQLDIQCADLAQRLYASGTAAIGTYIYLQCSMASRDPLDFHPFSISGLLSTTGPSDEAGDDSRKQFITLHIKDMGPQTWSGSLHRAVKDGEVLRCKVEGPYGKFGVRLEDYHTVMCVAGGIGFTPMAPVLSLYLSQDPQRVKMLPKLKRLVVVWVVQRAECFEWFDSLLQASKNYNPPAVAPERTLEVMLFITRQWEDMEMRDIVARNPEHCDAASAADEGVSYTTARAEASRRSNDAASRYEKKAGRPNMGEVFDRLLPKDAESADDPSFKSGVCVFGCGPASLMADTRCEAVRAGVHTHFETFFL